MPEDIPWDIGVLLTGDGLGVPYHSSRRVRPQAGETVAVFGCGPVGLGNVLLYSFLGCKVLAVDLSEERRRLALSLGAAAEVDGAGDPVEEIRTLIREAGFEPVQRTTLYERLPETPLESIARHAPRRAGQLDPHALPVIG